MSAVSIRRLWLSGAAALLTASGATLGADLERGKQLYEECAACHSSERGAHGLGPSLHGVAGRKAGELEDFRYSPALKRSGITWTAQSLDAYVADPQKSIPANRMPYSGMPDARDRADLIAYIQSALK